MALENGKEQANDISVPIMPIVKNGNALTLIEDFSFRFKRKPAFVVRVPGRVNLIGEHIDYCGYPVMPMALAQDILLAVKINSDLALRISNVNAKYKDFSGSMDNIVINNSDLRGPVWHNYVLCGIRGALEALPDTTSVKGVTILISGNVPPASGLSSSSALVSAAALAVLHAHDVQFSKTEMAAMCARCERYIGTEGGGMDQAIAFLAVRGCAQYIQWNPVRALSITLPVQADFVVAHSLVEANKAATGDFNERVAECRLAAKLLAMKTGVFTRLKSFTLCELQCQLKKTIKDMINLVKLHLTPQPYNRTRLCEVLEITPEELSDKHVPANIKHVFEFKLYQRALHVFEEAERVEKFKSACLEWGLAQESKYVRSQNSQTNGIILDSYKNGIFGNIDDCHLNSRGDSPDACEYIKVLGNLMRESHKSLQHLYECSHPNLDQLVELSDEFGASARLTGAGWGGCVVALCPANRTEEYVSMLKERFYKSNDAGNERDLSSLIFVTSPKQGAEIFSV